MPRRAAAEVVSSSVDVSAPRFSSSTAPVVVARQPIFDRSESVVGFQLVSPTAPVGDPRGAASGLLVQSLADIGLVRLVGDRRAHVGVTRELLLTVRPLPLDPDRVVLEVPAEQADDVLLPTLRELKDAGFRIALDGAPADPLEGLFATIYAVRLDSDASTEMVNELHARGVTLIADGVDSRADYEACIALGFDLFQGRFFAEPVMLTGTPAPTYRLRALSMLVQRDVTSFEQLERVIEEDPGLSHKLVRLANSAFFGRRHPVGSIHQALMALGSVAVRRWAMLLVLGGVTDHPHHLLELGLLRARLCELVAARQPEAEADRAFTAGLFSVVDALLGVSMPHLLAELPFDERMARALAEHEGPEGRVLAGVLSYERGDFAGVLKYGLSLMDIAHAYREALDWTTDAAVALSA